MDLLLVTLGVYLILSVIIAAKCRQFYLSLCEERKLKEEWQMRCKDVSRELAVMNAKLLAKLSTKPSLQDLRDFCEDIEPRSAVFTAEGGYQYGPDSEVPCAQ